MVRRESLGCGTLSLATALGGTSAFRAQVHRQLKVLFPRPWDGYRWGGGGLHPRTSGGIVGGSTTTQTVPVGARDVSDRVVNVVHEEPPDRGLLRRFAQKATSERWRELEGLSDRVDFMSRDAARGARTARVIRPRMSMIARFRRIITYHELLVGMVRKELKVKYKNSVLGFAWSLLNPLLYLVVFYIAFVKILGSAVPAFPIYLLSGLLVWNLFSVGLGSACGAVVGNAGLVKKVAFPREILPLAAVGSTLIQFFLQSLVLFTVLGLVRWHVNWSYLPLIPLALLALLLITASLGILLGAVNVYLRDTQHFLELALLAWFWVTPVVYGFMTIGKRGGWFTKVYMTNPVTPIVLIFQRGIYGRLDNTKLHTPILPHWSLPTYLAYLGYSFAFGFVMLLIAVTVFGRVEANFAEEL
jgi:ABC-2 type transport system permease protein